MLVLSRKLMECINIGDDAVVTVLSIRGNKVKLGIEAPRSVPVHRTELIEAISGSHGQSAECSPPLRSSAPTAPAVTPLKARLPRRPRPPT